MLWKWYKYQNSERMESGELVRSKKTYSNIFQRLILNGRLPHPIIFIPAIHGFFSVKSFTVRLQPDCQTYVAIKLFNRLKTYGDK